MPRRTASQFQFTEGAVGPRVMKDTKHHSHEVERTQQQMKQNKQDRYQQHRDQQPDGQHARGQHARGQHDKGQHDRGQHDRNIQLTSQTQRSKPTSSPVADIIGILQQQAKGSHSQQGQVGRGSNRETCNYRPNLGVRYTSNNYRRCMYW